MPATFVNNVSTEKLWSDFKVKCEGLKDEGESWYNHSAYIFKTGDRQLEYIDSEDSDVTGVKMVETLEETDKHKLYNFLYN